MKRIEAKDIMMKYLLPSLEPVGFKYKQKNSSDFEIVRLNENSIDKIVGGFTDYNPAQQIVYSLSKSHLAVSELLLKTEIKLGKKLMPPIRKDEATIGFSHGSLEGSFQKNSMPIMETEHDVETAVADMIFFLNSTAFPLLHQFEDIKKVDQIINSDDPWENDWQKPFSLGLYFHLKRLIICKLSGQSNYKSILDFQLKILEEGARGKYADDFIRAIQEVKSLDDLLDNDIR